MQPFERIDSWNRHLTADEFMDAVNKDYHTLENDDNIRMKKKNLSLEQRVLLTYKRIHNYLGANAKFLNRHDYDRIARLEKRITGVETHTKCKDPQKSVLGSLVEKLRYLGKLILTDKLKQVLPFPSALITLVEAYMSLEDVIEAKACGHSINPAVVREIFLHPSEELLQPFINKIYQLEYRRFFELVVDEGENALRKSPHIKSIHFEFCDQDNIASSDASLVYICTFCAEAAGSNQEERWLELAVRCLSSCKNHDGFIFDGSYVNYADDLTCVEIVNRLVKEAPPRPSQTAYCQALRDFIAQYDEDSEKIRVKLEPVRQALKHCLFV